ncbi:MAG TPA: DUF664 domain-containing protein [Pseudonocardia sp.]|nr:DUF664 domain-containing protein [Pseudonocardia sp.]
MGTIDAVLRDAFGRVREGLHGAVDGLDPEALALAVEPGTNTIAWLAWHLTRVQDDHIADLAGVEQVWTSEGWLERFDLPLDRLDTGYGHTAAQVASIRPASSDLLSGYHDAVYEQTLRYLARLDDAELARVVDTAWDPPVTAAVRLVSVLSDDLQHVGQAAMLRGILARRGSTIE